MRVSRRRFLQGSAAAGLGLASPLFADERPMPTRALGRTGETVSLAGLGTAQWRRRSVDFARGADILHRAIDLGVTYFDTAYSYGRGHAEECLGRAFKAKPGLRDKVFLNSKTIPRDRESARRELETTLRRLQTDRLDSWQFHALRSTGDTDRILGRGGALEAGLEAQKAGKVRFLGITGHYEPAVFVDALQRHAFDTLLIPLSCIDPHHRSFESVALPEAHKRQTGVVAMKVYCSGRLPRDRIVKAEDCLRYTYGLKIATCIVGCVSRAEIERAAHVARNLVPLSKNERATLLRKTKPHSPGLEWYKR